jgi:membrane-bound serine protease (ClpP class)
LIEKILLTIIGLFLLYEVLEHIILPLLGLSFRHKQAFRSSREGIVGQSAEVVEWKGKSGMVRLNGEYWQASAEESFTAGNTVKVVHVQGLKLKVIADFYRNSK